VRRRIDRPAQDAEVAFTATGVQRVAERTGLRVDRRWLRDRVEAALLRPRPADRLITARVAKVAPDVTRDELADRHATVVTVDRASFTLRLFKRLKLVKSYPIAVGQVGLETPPGLYDIQNKAVDPAWSVPNSDWAGALAGSVIPGGVPENPLKARWLGIYNGVGIHGTAERASIGSNASHGCIRMLVEDVTDLYDRVPVGADVYIA
jgi:lipoprotein-anchoring transpeptidase ErfK/SrfK